MQSSLFSYQMNIYQCFQYRVITRSNTLVSSDVTITNTLYPQTNNHTPHHATVSTSYKQLTIHSKDCYLMVGMESEHCIHCSVIHVCSALVQLFVRIIICLSFVIKIYLSIIYNSMIYIVLPFVSIRVLSQPKSWEMQIYSI